MDKPTRQALLGMKAELSKGWVQGELSTGAGVCVFGAAVEVGHIQAGSRGSEANVAGRTGGSGPSYSFSLEETPVGRAISALAAQAGTTWDELALWNDAPERTHEEIVGLIDATLAAHPVERVQETTKDSFVYELGAT